MSLESSLHIGLAFQRPPAATALAGVYFFARDAQELSLCDGTQWLTAPLAMVFGPSGTAHSIGAVPDPGDAAGSSRYLREDASWATPDGSGGGALTLIREVVLTAPSASIDFIAIPATFRHLRIVAVLCSAKSASYDSYELRFNGDSSAGHYAAYQGTPGGSNAQVESTAGFLGFGTASGSTAGMAISFDLVFPHYANTSLYKGWVGTASMNYNEFHGPSVVGGEWAITDATSEIALFADGGDLVAGSMASLYGMS
jgi:hypothetical protein